MVAPRGTAGSTLPVAGWRSERYIFYWNDHSPPHFHVEFAEHRGQVSLETLELMEGSLPAAKLAAIRLWASSRQKDLLECWNKARNNEHPGMVE
jgi:Domain of unknown function (DUF4160)